MSWTHSVAGSLCVYLGGVMLISCSPSAAQSIRAPAIVNTAQRRLATGYRISCKVNPGGLKDETMVYWLADGEFLEKVYKNIRVTQTARQARDGTDYLYTKVVFRDFTPEDFHTNVTCVALSPAGFATQNLRLMKDGRR